MTAPAKSDITLRPAIEALVLQRDIWRTKQSAAIERMEQAQAITSRAQRESAEATEAIRSINTALAQLGM